MLTAAATGDTCLLCTPLQTPKHSTWLLRHNGNIILITLTRQYRTFIKAWQLSWSSPNAACVVAVLVAVQECWSVVCIGPHDTDISHERCIQKFMRGMPGKNYDP